METLNTRIFLLEKEVEKLNNKLQETNLKSKSKEHETNFIKYKISFNSSVLNIDKTLNFNQDYLSKFLLLFKTARYWDLNIHFKDILKYPIKEMFFQLSADPHDLYKINLTKGSRYKFLDLTKNDTISFRQLAKRRFKIETSPLLLVIRDPNMLLITKELKDLKFSFTFTFKIEKEKYNMELNSFSKFSRYKIN